MKEIIKDLSFLELFIINTIIYFDIFDYPLTANEICTYLYTGGMEMKPFALDEIKNALAESSQLKKIIAAKNGLYFLKGRERNIQRRLERYKLADKKFKIAKRAIRVLKFLPFVKLIAVCNNLSYQNAQKESDIDFFIISEKKRLYLVRFLVTAVVSLLGIRRHGPKITNRICLSFYVSEENLDLSKIKIAAEDIYLSYWLATLWPSYVRDGFYEKFMEKNAWLKKTLPNFFPLQIGYRYRADDGVLNKSIYKAKEFILRGYLGDFLESFAKKLQLKIMAQKKKDLAAVGDNRVIISDAMLKFHEKDRRLFYLQEFEKKRLEVLNNL
jgi:hypothetical protein